MSITIGLDLINEYNRLLRDNTILREQLRIYEHDANQLRQQAVIDHETIKQLKKDNKKLKDRLTKVEEDNNILKNKVDVLEDKNKILEENNKILEDKVEELTEDKNIANNKINKLQEQMEYILDDKITDQFIIVFQDINDIYGWETSFEYPLNEMAIEMREMRNSNYHNIRKWVA